MAGSRYPGLASGITAVFKFPYAMPSDILNSVSTQTAGSTAVWTPGTGNKFRLLEFVVSLTGDASPTGSNKIELLDGSTVIWSAYLSAGEKLRIPLNAGILSAAANDVLSVNLGTALTAGWLNCSTVGLEEG